MDIVKKNALSIACGVVALAAVVALFWPIGGMYSSFQTDLDARGAEYKKVEDLRTAPRKLPTLVLDGSAEQPALDRFPNQAVVDEGKKKTDALKEQSDRMVRTVSERNVRQLLVPGSLPTAAQTARSAFPSRYREVLGLVEESPELGLPNFNVGLPKALNATRPPFEDELKEMANKIWDDKFAKRVLQFGADNNLQALSEEFIEEIRTLPETERLKRANSHAVYLDETSLPASPEILALQGKQPREAQMWYAQTALWVTEDVVNAINTSNKGSTSITTSPIKHLVRLSIPFGIGQYVLGTQATGAAAGGEGAVLPTDANGVAQVFALSPTGRVSNDVYDVIHFELVLRVDYRKIPKILAEMEQNRLFTVLGTAVTSVDAKAEYDESGYVYGNDPVAEITLQCEALFLRSWTVDKENTYKAALMPQEVRGQVGAEVVAGLSPATGGGGEAPATGEEMMY